MKASINCINLIKQFEGCSLKAYKDPGSKNGLPITIGYGSTYYADGKVIKLTDTITQQKAVELLVLDVDKKAAIVSQLLVGWNQNQFDAIVCFAYNVGIGNLQKSTLLKLAKQNVNDPAIKDEFMKWNKAGGKVLNGLTKRRYAEAMLYFS